MAGRYDKSELLAGVERPLFSPIAALGFWIVESSAEVEFFARQYFHIRVIAAPATITLYAFTGWFIGMQNTRLPMVIALSFFTIRSAAAGDTILAVNSLLLSSNPEIIAAAKPYLLWTAVIPLISFAAFIWDGIYIGATASVQMRNAMLLSTLLVYFPAYYLLQTHFGNHALWLAFVLFLLARGVTLGLMVPGAIFKKQ